MDDVLKCSLQNLMLVAHENGIRSVWVGALYEEEISEILKLPPNLRPVAIVPVGYPAEFPTPPPRVSENQAVVFVD